MTEPKIEDPEAYREGWEAYEEHRARGMFASPSLHWGPAVVKSFWMGFRERRDGKPNRSCADCGGTGWKITNPEWPKGAESYRERCPEGCAQPTAMVSGR